MESCYVCEGVSDIVGVGGKGETLEPMYMPVSWLKQMV
jgi:hypothetical protein